jgi:hypothetical protein
LSDLAQCRNDSGLTTAVKCYSLPFGALGFISHILTYYTIWCITFKRRPLLPFSRISHKHNLFDFTLGVAKSSAGSAIALQSMIGCRGSWQLAAIATWKLNMSVWNGSAGTLAALAYIKGGL